MGKLQQAGLCRPCPNPTFDNPLFEKAGFRVLIVRLSPFRDVDRSIPHLFLAGAVRRAVPDAYVDMCFLPPVRDRKLMEKEGIPFLTGTQSFHSIEDFSLVLVSNSYTLELINLPFLLLRSGIPPEAGLRDEKWPPVILGGSNAMAAQALIREDGESIADAVFFGEGERQVEKLVLCLKENAGVDKRDRLRRAAAMVAGLWVSGRESGYPANAVRKSVVPDLGVHDLIVQSPILNSAEAGTAHLQVTQGCPAFCGFCFEGFDRLPYREIPLADLLDQARKLKRAQGCETLELYGFNVGSHSDFAGLLVELSRMFENVGIKSQRVDTLCESPDLLRAEVVVDKRSFTLGIEGISGRQRARLNKSLSATEISGVLEELFQQKVREIKLFFILTGDEDAADLAEFRAFCIQVGNLRRQHNPGLRVIFSFGLLVRMPRTPMRYERLRLEFDEWSPIIDSAEAACRDHGFEFRLSTTWADYCVSQVTAMGGHWLYEPIVQMARDGCCYDTRLDERWWQRLRDWMRANGRWTPEFLGEKGHDYSFALPFVMTGVSDDFLYRQYVQSKQCVDTGYCLGRASKSGKCLGCGACADTAQKKSIVKHESRLPEDRGWVDELRGVMETKRRLDPVYAVFELPAAVRGVDPAWANAFVFQGILSALPELTDNLLSVQEQLFTKGNNLERFGPLPGRTVLGLKAWNREDVLLALPRLAGVKSGGLLHVSDAKDFAPGYFREATVRLTIRKEPFPGSDRRLHEFLRAGRVKFSIRKEKRGYSLELHGRQGGLLECAYRHEGERFAVRMRVGPKFNLTGLLQALGAAAGCTDAEVRVEDVSLK